MEKRSLWTDEELFEKVKAGDRHAYEIMFRRYYPVLLGFLSILRADPDTAEDLLQDLFADIWAKRTEIVIRASLKSYLYTSAKNRYFNLLQAPGTLPLEEGHRQLASSLPDPESAMVSSETVRQLNHYIDLLPQAIRRTFRLRLLGKKQQEIASETGVSENTVEKQLGSARKKLRNMMMPDLG